jgi:hypothetical protein
MTPTPLVLLGTLRGALVGCGTALCPGREAASFYLPSVDLGRNGLDACSSLVGHGGGLGRRREHMKPLKKDVARIGNV